MRLLCGKDCLKAKHIKTQNKTNHGGTDRYTEVPKSTQRYTGVQSTQKYQRVTQKYPEVPKGTQRYR